MARKNLSKRLRFEVFKRDKFTCQYCGRTPPTVVLHCDHIVAVVSGGDSEMSNLVTSCADCNLGKGAVSIERVHVPLTVNLDEQAEKIRQLKEYEVMLVQEKERFELIKYDVVSHWAEREGQDDAADSFFYPTGMESALRRFIKELPASEIIDAIDITFDNPRVRGSAFKYFCGVCWGKIKQKSDVRQTLQPDT